MARINISVPNELKESMDKYPSINWSQTACELFANKVHEIETSIEVKDMTDVIVRLKASKENFQTEIKKQGYEFGLEWAMKEASYEELFMIAKSIKLGWKRVTPICLQDLESLDFDGLLDDGADINEPAFRHGFIDAALEVFEKVNV